MEPINNAVTKVEAVLEGWSKALEAPARTVETKDEYHTADPIHRHNYEFLQGLCKLLTKDVESFTVRLAATVNGLLVDADDTTKTVSGIVEYEANVDRFGYVLNPIATQGIINSAWLMQPARSVVNPTFTVWPVTPITFIPAPVIMPMMQPMMFTVL